MVIYLDEFIFFDIFMSLLFMEIGYNLSKSSKEQSKVETIKVFIKKRFLSLQL